MIPEAVVQIRINSCGGKCDSDPTDPCAACPNGHWGPYDLLDCEGGVEKLRNRIIVARPGDLFSAVIFKLTGEITTSCWQCTDRNNQMNRWGWTGCWKHRKQIIAWIIEEAKKRGHDVSGGGVAKLVIAAFKEYKKS